MYSPALHTLSLSVPLLLRFCSDGSRNCRPQTVAHRLALTAALLPVGVFGLSRLARQQQKALDHSRDLGTATILHPYHPLYGQSFPILKIRKVDGQRRYSLRSEDDIFSVPESWITDTGQNAFSESYFDADTVKALLELAKLL
jgi:hypothetical protein